MSWEKGGLWGGYGDGGHITLQVEINEVLHYDIALWQEAILSLL